MGSTVGLIRFLRRSRVSDFFHFLDVLVDLMFQQTWSTLLPNEVLHFVRLKTKQTQNDLCYARSNLWMPSCEVDTIDRRKMVRNELILSIKKIRETNKETNKQTQRKVRYLVRKNIFGKMFSQPARCSTHQRTNTFVVKLFFFVTEKNVVRSQVNIFELTKLFFRTIDFSFFSKLVFYHRPMTHR